MLFAIKVSNFFLTPQQKIIVPLLIVRFAHWFRFSHKKQNVSPFLVSAKKIISPSPKIPPRPKPAPSPHNPKICPDVKKDLLPFRSIIFHQERSKLFSSKNNAANYSFVSCSHPDENRECANFQTHKLLLQSFRIECFSSCLDGKAGVQLLENLFCPPINKLSVIRIFAAGRGKGIWNSSR